jgi:hypothetical protein
MTAPASLFARPSALSTPAAGHDDLRMKPLDSASKCYNAPTACSSRALASFFFEVIFKTCFFTALLPVAVACVGLLALACHLMTRALPYRRVLQFAASCFGPNAQTGISSKLRIVLPSIGLLFARSSAVARASRRVSLVVIAAIFAPSPAVAQTFPVSSVTTSHCASVFQVGAYHAPMLYTTEGSFAWVAVRYTTVAPFTNNWTPETTYVHFEICPSPAFHRMILFDIFSITHRLHLAMPKSGICAWLSFLRNTEIVDPFVSQISTGPVPPICCQASGSSMLYKTRQYGVEVLNCNASAYGDQTSVFDSSLKVVNGFLESACCIVTWKVKIMRRTIRAEWSYILNQHSASYCATFVSDSCAALKELSANVVIGPQSQCFCCCAASYVTATVEQLLLSQHDLTTSQEDLRELSCIISLALTCNSTVLIVGTLQRLADVCSIGSILAPHVVVNSIIKIHSSRSLGVDYQSMLDIDIDASSVSCLDHATVPLNSLSKIDFALIPTKWFERFSDWLRTDFSIYYTDLALALFATIFFRFVSTLWAAFTAPLVLCHFRCTMASKSMKQFTAAAVFTAFISILPPGMNGLGVNESNCCSSTLAEHPHVAADAGLGRDDAIRRLRPEISCKINECALLQRGRLSHSFLPVAKQEADAEDRRCCDRPHPYLLASVALKNPWHSWLGLLLGQEDFGPATCSFSLALRYRPSVPTMDSFQHLVDVINTGSKFVPLDDFDSKVTTIKMRNSCDISMHNANTTVADSLTVFSASQEDHLVIPLMSRQKTKFKFLQFNKLGRFIALPQMPSSIYFIFGAAAPFKDVSVFCVDILFAAITALSCLKLFKYSYSKIISKNMKKLMATAVLVAFISTLPYGVKGSAQVNIPHSSDEIENKSYLIIAFFSLPFPFM